MEHIQNECVIPYLHQSVNIKPYIKDKRYLVLSDGRIWSTIFNRFLRPAKSDGYLITVIGGKGVRVHRVVAETFIPNDNNLPIVNHINGDRCDNSINNLEWCTHSHNMIHSRNNTNNQYSMNACKKKIIQYNSTDDSIVKIYNS